MDGVRRAPGMVGRARAPYRQRLDFRHPERPMKKLAVKRKPTPKKRVSSSFEALLADMDMATLRQLLADEEPLEEEGLEDMIDEFLSTRPESAEDLPDAAAIFDLSEELDRLRIDANGGDREARETLNAVREKIDKASRRDEIQPDVLILLGRLFPESKVAIGSGARALMGRMVAAGLFKELGEQGYRALVQPLLLGPGRDPFALHAEIRSIIAIFPTAYTSALIEALAADSKALAHQVPVCSLLEPDQPL